MFGRALLLFDAVLDEKLAFGEVSTILFCCLDDVFNTFQLRVLDTIKETLDLLGLQCDYAFLFTGVVGLLVDFDILFN